MLKISFKVDGKEVKVNSVGNALRQSIFNSIEEQVRETVGILSCPIHKESPQIIIHGDDLEDLKLEFAGCCDELLSIVSEKFSG
ncbi:hypothetical protein CXF86_17440 [Shewanella sp. GutCb]|jgi:hypothetical protein|uniref:hypothetical protein n=1 Tax=Shewanella sp. GutCb TaxID=2058315 RepID=UPI000C7C9600|nr:hypothetical protein [Shewanella sp. GutCb]PKG73493.1 hypothetical protein CXF86_17440 [Shewanella sp. GutCb]